MKTNLEHAIELLTDGAKTIYVCPMHPEVTSETPGICPKCSMRLEPKPLELDIFGMTCAACVRRVDKALRAVDSRHFVRRRIDAGG